MVNQDITKEDAAKLADIFNVVASRVSVDEEVISGKAYEEIKLKEDTTLEVRISFKGI